MIYLAGPIDDVSQQESQGWRNHIAGLLYGKGFGCFNPARAYHLGSKPMEDAETIVGINKAAICQCSLLLANLVGPGRAFGTIREIEYAVNMEKPVLVMHEDSLQSLSAYDIVSIESDPGATSVAHYVRVADKVDEIIGSLRYRTIGIESISGSPS